MKTQEFHTIIVAGGVGNRLGSAVPKAYIDLGGIPMVARTVAVFYTMPDCKSITIVIHPEHETLAQDKLKQFPNIKFVYGGDTRQASVKNGIESLNHLDDDEIIVIHDAARPFITADLIRLSVSAADKHGAVSLAIPIIDTLRRCNSVTDKETVDRNDLYAMQTPQVFKANLIRMAHAQDFIATDDTELVGELGYKVHIVDGARTNFKITTKDDVEFANMLLTSQKRYKTGLGYDVHAFDDMPATSIRLGGIDIPFTKKLKGHSDADVVLHAITDAIYGAISEGDIGFHFPPSKAEHKNQDSADFLKHSVNLASQKLCSITHIDCVIICEEPKITPHRDSMRARIAEICNLPLSSVSVKATTSEGLGFTGRREGIACQAVVTIESPV
jgi:2-C-methyl-D-erythritol 4-phosphate cytidylyltransferase/2-C-methyl-D-erythritol 2,4-cyclodiphosphate synthase